MKVVIQVGVFLLVLFLLLLAFKRLVKSRLLPLLLWCGLGWKLYRWLWKPKIVRDKKEGK